jgi:CubicO group peptidase (beta-lactamase class C family)
MRTSFLRPFLALALAAVLPAEVLTPAAPEQTGFAADRLDRINKVFRTHVDEQRLPGGIGLIARKGKIVFFETWGYQDRESKKPMRKDSIFRMYSMTKAVTGVAAMMLAEEGKFFLNDPVSKFIPEMANMKIAVEKKDADGKRVVELVDAKNRMTIRDLMRHTAGFSYTGPTDASGRPAFYTAQLPVAPTPDLQMNLEEWAKALAKLPLHREPGTAFQYGVNTDVLGRVVEAASGMPLDKFFEERIFKPLGMVDTGFHVPENKLDRFVTLYEPVTGTTVKPTVGGPQDVYKKPAKVFFGGAGLVSTAMDYAKFCQMLLNNGELNGKRLLGRKSVEAMRADHLGAMPKADPLVPPGYGFGLTFAVSKGTGAAGEPGSEGEYNWGGAAGTRFWIDPKEELFGVFMVNILPHTARTFGQQFRQLTYQALVD